MIKMDKVVAYTMKLYYFFIFPSRHARVDGIQKKTHKKSVQLQ